MRSTILACCLFFGVTDLPAIAQNPDLVVSAEGQDVGKPDSEPIPAAKAAMAAWEVQKDCLHSGRGVAEWTVYSKGEVFRQAVINFQFQGERYLLEFN